VVPSPTEWYLLLPMLPQQGTWREYMTAAFHGQLMESFPSFPPERGEREMYSPYPLHDIGHLIVCDDSAVTHPSFGLPLPDVNSDDIDDEGFFPELDAVFVQCRLEAYKYTLYPICEYAHYDPAVVASYYSVIWKVYGFTEGEVVAYLKGTPWAKMSIEQLYLEFCRKAAMVREALSHDPRRSVALENL